MRSSSQDDRLVLEPFEGYYGGAPGERRLVLKVVPDDTMRGLELRKGTVDLVVNDLVARHRVAAARRKAGCSVATAPGTDYAYIGLNLRDPMLRATLTCARRSATRSIARRSSRYLRRGFATVAVGIVPPMSWAFEPNVFDFRHDPERGARGCSTRPGFPIPTATARSPACDCR